jgi:hypothetical protein
VRGWPANPFCECGRCDATGEAGPAVLLPADAWAAAGEADLNRMAVAPGHEAAYRDEGYAIEEHDGWLAVVVVTPSGGDDNVPAA